jgi:hypothetical protein
MMEKDEALVLAAAIAFPYSGSLFECLSAQRNSHSLIG